MVTFSFLKTPSMDQKKQMLALYHAEKWWPESIDDPNRIDQIINGSHCILVASLDTEIIGMGRALSDSTGDAYLHDITVKINHRKKGIGNEIVARLMNRLKDDGISWVGLIAERGSFSFYKKQNFRIMENSAPMFIEI